MLTAIIQKLTITKMWGIPLLLLATLKFTKEDGIGKECFNSEEVPRDNFPHVVMSSHGKKS